MGVAKHGMAAHPAYWVWRAMHDCCRLITHQAYHNYGGRGITVCKRWEKFEKFWEDMGPTYEAGLTLDRKNNQLGYIQKNCRWVSYTTQAQNRRTNVHVETPRGRMTVSQAAREFGINRSTLYYRVEHNVPLGFTT